MFAVTVSQGLFFCAYQTATFGFVEGLLISKGISNCFTKSVESGVASFGSNEYTTPFKSLTVGPVQVIEAYTCPVTGCTPKPSTAR